MVSRRQVEEYRTAQKMIEDAAVGELEAAWAQALRLDDFTDRRDLMVNAVAAVIEKYGSMVASVAADWYEMLVEVSAYVPDLYDPDAWAASTRWALSPLFRHGDNGSAFAQLVSVVGRNVKNYGRLTIDASAQRSRGVSYARVPSGMSTCDFCLVLASRGPVYRSELSARFQSDGRRYHDDCDCVAVPVAGKWVPDSSTARGVRWEGQSIAGYDFEKLYAEEYKPYWRSGMSISEVVARRTDARAAEPWGGVTWLEDLRESTVAPPSWWDDAARQKTLVGHPGRRPGQWNGGHGYGQNVPGKTEFPERWTEEDIDLILAETWSNPAAVRFEGDRRYARRIFDGVLVQVEAYGESYETFRTYFAVGGRGVFYNEESNRVEKRIPTNADGWEMTGG